MMASSRAAFAIKSGAWHLVGSLVVAVLAALLVFVIWFPSPYDQLSGGRKLFLILISVDIVCGPLLTMVIASPRKPRAELVRDISMIALVQLASLVFGLNTLAQARPLAVVHEVDRFRILSISDIDERDLSNAPDWLKAWAMNSPKLMGVRAARSGEMTLGHIEEALAGIENSQKPSWWQDYNLSVPAVLVRARKLPELAQKHPFQVDFLADAVAKTGQTEGSLRWLPVTSRQTMDWVGLIDASTGDLRGFVHLDGF